MIVFRILAFALLIALVIYQSTVIRRLTTALKQTKGALEESDGAFTYLNGLYKNLKEDMDRLILEKEDREDVSGRLFGVEEDDSWYGFNVYMQGRYGRYPVKRIFYDPDDPDDREYKRIHAEEVAEILNEKV